MFDVYLVLTCDAKLTDLRIDPECPYMHDTEEIGTEDARRSFEDPWFEFAVLSALASGFTVVLAIATPVDDTRTWAFAALGAVLVALGTWLAVASRRGSTFARSLRSPAAWLIGAGLAGLISAWTVFEPTIISLYDVFFVWLWPLALVCTGAGYAVSAIRLAREGMTRHGRTGHLDSFGGPGGDSRRRGASARRRSS